MILRWESREKLQRLTWLSNDHALESMADRSTIMCSEGLQNLSQVTMKILDSRLTVSMELGHRFCWSVWTEVGSSRKHSSKKKKKWQLLPLSYSSSSWRTFLKKFLFFISISFRFFSPGRQRVKCWMTNSQKNKNTTDNRFTGMASVKYNSWTRVQPSNVMAILTYRSMITKLLHFPFILRLILRNKASA